MDPFSDVVEVKSFEGKGNCLVAVKRLPFGQLVFSEEPLFMSNPVTDLFDKIVLACSNITNLEFQPNWYNGALVALTSTDTCRVTAFSKKWFPADSNTEESAIILDALSLTDNENMPLLTSKALRDAVLIWRYNSFAHHSDNNSLIMYNMTSFMSHSCKPSCVWSFGDGDTFNLRAVRDLVSGCELTISYISEDQVAMPTILRRKLLEGWKFHCSCERCSPSHDKLRVLKCPTCNFGELTLQSVACAETPGCVAECPGCAVQLTAAQLLELVEVEQLYFDRLATIDASNLGDLQNVYREATRIFTSSNWIIYKLESLLLSHSKNLADGLALAFMQNKVKYLERLGFPTYSLGWAYEEIGDWLISTAQQSNDTTTLARYQYEKAYWVMRTITGADSGYSVSIQTKWANLSENQ